MDSGKKFQKSLTLDAVWCRCLPEFQLFFFLPSLIRFSQSWRNDWWIYWTTNVHLTFLCNMVTMMSLMLLVVVENTCQIAILCNFAPFLFKIIFRDASTISLESVALVIQSLFWINMVVFGIIGMVALQIIRKKKNKQ